MFNTIVNPLDYTLPAFSFFRRQGLGTVRSDTPNEDLQFLKGTVESVLLDNSQVQLALNQSTEARLTGMSYGSPDAGGILPTLTDTYSIKDGYVFPDFEKRKAEGEIMVSDYTRIELRVRRKPGLKFQTQSDEAYWSNLGWQALVNAGHCYYQRIAGKHMMLFKNGILVLAHPSRTVAYYRRTTLSGGAWVYPPVVSPEAISSQILDQKPDSRGLVTNVVAKANQASLDVLTAMAEMPKAIKSILAGLKQVAYMAKDVKKGEILVKNKFGARKRDLNLKFHRDVTRLKTGLADPTISSKRKRALEKQLSSLNAQHSRNMKSHADEFANALADVWLNFRYNIMPNVYVAQDIYDAMDRYRKEYITSRGFNPGSVLVNVPSFHPETVQTKTSVVVRRNFTAQAAEQARGVISNDIFVTAWELVPLSFVVDWFINIGDLLSSMSYNPSWAQEGATIAYAAQDINFVLHPITPYAGFQIDPLVSVSGFVYERKVFDPTSSCGLVWNPTVGLARQVDALALIWRPVRSLLINSKR